MVATRLTINCPQNIGRARIFGQDPEAQPQQIQKDEKANIKIMRSLKIKSNTPKPEGSDELRMSAKRWDKRDTMYRQNEDGTRSTHKMASGEEDGRGIAFPTVFPKDRAGTMSHDAKDWIELDGKAAIDTARARGELYEFKNPANAAKWAEGEYKKNK